MNFDREIVQFDHYLKTKTKPDHSVESAVFLCFRSGHVRYTNTPDTVMPLLG